MPVGISANNLSVFWPLWDAALLQRYGRPIAATWLTPPWWWVPPRPCCSPAPRFCLVRPPSPIRPSAGGDPPPISTNPLPELDLRWPSDAPPQPPQIIVVERWLREPPHGEFVDVLY